eukprot:TRINITY_DN9872_c0_g1_i1.p1 TRINITY_DN9872_c0_g1~~TRINITY_DN9872_c0_g1_i1.p1  ORF type:complete len:195 (-),score=53.94 TRINITY_DN9872_c0_g1_i1:4-588(-)
MSKRKHEDITKEKILPNVVAVFSGQKDPTKLIEKLEKMGGCVKDKWIVHGISKTSHLICSSKTPEFEHVERLGGTIVTEDWIEDCFQQKKKLRESDYVFPPKPKSNELLSIFSEMIFYLEKESPDLYRYIIAFDGEICEDIEEATHILCEKEPKEMTKKKAKEGTKFVKTQWAWNSIKSKQREDMTPFLIDSKE